MMKIFKVNEFINLHFEDNKTTIYINREKFLQCKSLMLNINMNKLGEINSIDEVSENLDRSLEKISLNQFNITPEIEFWAHCSNLQVWNENNYNTKLLHSNLAFPLLKKLTEVGDPIARKMFKEEIAKRLETGPKKVRYYLTLESYTKILNYEELEVSLNKLQNKLQIWLEKEVANKPNNMNLHGCGLLYLPSLIDRMERMEYLDLGVNNLYKLPDTICNLRLLKELNVSLNNLQELPKNIGNLEQLKVLKAYSNNIKKIPKSIGNLALLKRLNMNNNKLMEFPKCLCNLKKLEKINLANNKITTMSEEIGRLHNLKKLELTHNKLKKIPTTIGDLDKLKYLNLSHNKLEKIPETIGNLKSIKYIYLNHNRLESIPKTLGDIESLEVLNLSSNYLRYIPIEMKNLKNVLVIT